MTAKSHRVADLPPTEAVRTVTGETPPTKPTLDTHQASVSASSETESSTTSNTTKTGGGRK